MTRTRTDPETVALDIIGYIAHMAAPDYVQKLTESGAFKRLSVSDAGRVGTQIRDCIGFYATNGHTECWGVNVAANDPRCLEQLDNKSACAAYLADGQGWDNPAAVSRAFTAAKAALISQR